MNPARDTDTLVFGSLTMVFLVVLFVALLVTFAPTARDLAWCTLGILIAGSLVGIAWATWGGG